MVPVTLWVGTILRIHTSPSCCRQPSSWALATSVGIPHFLSHLIPLSRASPHCSPASAFHLQHILSFAHHPKPQHPMHPFLPVHWHWTPQSSFQSLNTDLARGETDSYYPILRKVFRQGKLITSVTAVSFLTEIEGTTTKSSSYSSQNYPERCDIFIFLLLP